MSASTDTDTDLGTELLQIETQTLDDGRVRGRIVDIEDSDETITLTVLVLSTREEFTVAFEKPTSWTKKNRFVRLVEWCGYNSASAAEIEGSIVPLAAADDGWDLDFERIPGKGLIEKRDFYAGVWRGVKGTLLFSLSVGVGVGLVTDALIIEINSPTFLEMVGFGVLGIVSLFLFLVYLHEPVDDEKEYATHDAMTPAQLAFATEDE